SFDHLLPSAMPYYEMLREAEIIVDSPEQAAKHVELHWDDIEKWWGSDEVQNARKLFCQHYARTEKHPVRTLKYLLTHDL
ncbi:MAG: transferase, partial [Kordiimonadaceae bacterium]|nr:transferase [Kordiimonadaceae bacterium]